MTSVSTIASILQPTANDSQRSSAKDFAHELAKQEQGEEGGTTREAPSSIANKATESITQSGGNASARGQAESSADGDIGAPLAASNLDVLEQYAAVTSPVGITEALLATRVFGWHTLPQAFLSEWAVSSADAADSEDKSVETESSLNTSEAAFTPGPTVSASSLSLAPELGVQDKMPDVAFTERQSATQTESTTNADEALPAIADVSATDYWAERSLRYSRSPDGSGVAWLRDFRIDDGEVAELIGNVLSEAKANGFILSKIMLNGREAWSSPSEAKTKGG